MLVVVGPGGIDKALKTLKRKLVREGVFKEMKRRAHFEKPCDVRKRKHAAAVRRSRRQQARRDP